MSASRSQWIRVTDSSEAGQVRRAAVAMARSLDFDETGQGRAGIVATEAATNILKHARSGSVLLQPLAENGERAMQVIAMDRGPGMEDFARCAGDGYSTAGSPGTGLGSIMRLSRSVDIYSRPGLGTVLVARLERDGSAQGPAAFVCSALSLAHPDEEVEGDVFGYREEGEALLVLVADGLGHGAEAARASNCALRSFYETDATAPVELIRELHRALVSTRGAAVAVARIDPGAGEISYCAVGNIAGAIAVGGQEKRLLTHNGIVGHTMRPPVETRYPWHRGAALILHSDGLSHRWNLASYPGLSECAPALVAAVLFRDHFRENDDALAAVIRER